MIKFIGAVITALIITTMPAQAWDFPTDNFQGTCYDGIERNSPAWESLCWAQEPAVAADQPSRFVLVGPRNLWGMRRTAKYVDRRVEGLRIHRKYGLTCESVPNRTACITVIPDNYGHTGWFGRAENLTLDYMIIRLNSYYREAEPYRDMYRQRTASHELLHPLGFTHHKQVGVVGIYGPRLYEPLMPSDIEIQVLRAWYNYKEEANAEPQEQAHTTSDTPQADHH